MNINSIDKQFPINTNFKKGRLWEEEAFYKIQARVISINYGTCKNPIILKFLAILNQALTKILTIIKRDVVLDKIVDNLRGEYGIKFAESNEVLAETDKMNIIFDMESVSIFFKESNSISNLEELLSDLYSLIQYHEFCHLIGLKEEDALYYTSMFFIQMKSEEHSNVFRILDILELKNIIHENLFYVFLKEIEDSLNNFKENELQLKIRKKISWFQSHRNMNHPYNLKRLQEILRLKSTKDEKTKLLLAEVFAHQIYNRQIEKNNAFDFAYKLIKDRRFLTVSRHSRASYFLILLASGSRLISELRTLEDAHHHIKELVNKIILVKGNELNEIITNGGFILENIIRKLEMISYGELIPSYAQISGRYKEIREAVDSLEKKINEQIMEIGKRKRLPKLELKLDDIRLELHGFFTRIRRITLESEDLLNTLKFEYPNFSILIQRASPTGVRALAWMCLGENPFEAEEKHIEEALREGTMNLWASPDNIWFKMANYWIEALPLYIHKELDTQKGERIIIEQEDMEEIFKNYLMHDWKDNIDYTMITEHLSIARHYICEYFPEFWAKKTKFMEKEPKIREEEIEYRIIEEINNSIPEITLLLCQLAVIIEKTWRNIKYDIAQRQADENLSRYEALLKELERSSHSTNLIKKINKAIRSDRKLSETIEEIIKQEDVELEKTALNYRLANRLDDYKKFIHWPRRELPTWIILTTQAAGMSSVCAANWLEEAMSLKAITEDFRNNGRTLEQDAEELANHYEDLINIATKKVVKEFGLDYLIKESEYINPDFNETQILKEMLYKYPDVAKEVAKICVINEILKPEQRNYEQEPDLVIEYINNNRDKLMKSAVLRVRKENVEIKDLPEEKILEDEDYKLVIENYIKILGRERIISRIEPKNIREVFEWYISSQTETSLPRFLRYRLKGSLGMITARYEVLSRYRITKSLNLVSENQNREDPYILFLRNDPVYDYASHGKNKKYNRGYGPSRVDLGLFERRSVEDWAQWIGPVDQFSKNTMNKFYELYNQNVHAFENVREAETMKPFENMMMEASLAISHLSMAIIQAIGIGDFYSYAYQTNIRPEIFIRLGGGGSSGFCQPKDIYFLPFIIGLTMEDALEFAGVPASNWSHVEDLYTKIKGKITEFFRPTSLKKLSEYLDQAIIKRKQELSLAGIYPDSLMMGGKAYSISGNLSTALDKIGFGLPIIDPEKFIKHLIALYSSNLFELLEGRIRFSNVALVWQIKEAINKVRKSRLEKGLDAPKYEDSIIVLPVEYKTVGDPRLSTGLKLNDLMVGLGSHLIKTLGNEGVALTNLLFYGFNKRDKEQINLINKGLGRLISEENIIETLEKLYPMIEHPYPKDIRLISPFGLTRDAVFNYVVGAELESSSEQARGILGRYLKEGQIKANVLSYGPMLEKWLGLNKNDLKTIKDELQGKIFALVWDIRLQDADYRNKIYTNFWESIRGTDVFCIIVHFTELTGPEDIDKTEERLEFMLLDLARIRDTMIDGNINSSLIIVDAPVQGRKPAFDIIAIKTWIALGGTYVSPSVAEETIDRYGKEMELDRKLTIRLFNAIISEDNLTANETFKDLKKFAYIRYTQAEIIEKHAQIGRERFRGGGFLNYSARHRLYREGWVHIVNAQTYEELTFELLLIAGLMYELNGRSDEEIEKTRLSFENVINRKRNFPSKVPFDESEKAAINNYFIRARFKEPIKGKIEVKGERSSIKSRDINVQNVEGKAKAMARERKRVKNLYIQRKGFEFALNDKSGGDKTISFIDLYSKAKMVLHSGKERINYEQFGTFLGYSYRAFETLLNNFIEDSELKQKIFKSVEKLYNSGLGHEQEKWRSIWEIFMGKEEDPGEIGRLALMSGGHKENLKQIALLAELVEILLALFLTFDFQFEETYTLTLSNQIFASIQVFFSMTIYDHVMDYPPRWMTPSEVGPGFTDYDYIMGEWMRKGKPFNREEVFSIAVSTHEWLYVYLSNLIRTRTWMSQLRNSQIDLITGDEETIPIGAGEDCYDLKVQRWYSYTQLRELAFLDRDGHKISWIFNEIEGNELSRGRPFAAIVSPIGRTHLTCYLAENPKYNNEYLESQMAWIITRSVKFEKREINDNSKQVMVIKDGLSYISAEEFRSLLIKQNIAAEEIESLIIEALKYNPDGILIACKFKQGVIACFSMPFHGWEGYQKGIDEKIGIPTGQEWTSNYWMYDKTYETLIHPENAGVLLPEEYQWYMKWQYKDFEQGIKRLEKDIVKEIINGREGYIGLKNLPWTKAIAKASRQSGGRGSKAMQIRDYEGKILDENLRELAEHIMTVGWIDNLVIQRTLPASPLLWASRVYIDKLRQELIAKGIPAPEDSQYFSYLRIIIVRDQAGDELHVFPLVVSSRATISNVGRGGVLFELLPEYFANPEQYKVFIKEMESTSSRSLELTQSASENLIKKLQSGQEVDEAAQLMKNRILISLQNGYKDLTGWSYTKPRYLMFDLIPMPVLSINGKRIRRPEILEVRYDKYGILSNFMVLDTKIWKIIDISVKNISGWDMILIENNVGYGLWHPFKEDQKTREYQRAEKEKDKIDPKNWGKDLRKVMYGFSTGAWSYYKALYRVSPEILSLPPIKVPYFKSEAIPIIDKYMPKEVPKEFGMDALSKGLSTYLREVIGSHKMLSWRNDWDESFAEDIVNELSKYVREHTLTLLKMLEQETGLTSEEIKTSLTGYYLERIYAEVSDSIFTERLIPGIKIYPKNYFYEKLENILDAFKYAFIFDGFLGRADDIYTLIHSSYIAYERFQNHPSKIYNPIVIMGINKNWIDEEGRIHRVLIYDFEIDSLIESDLKVPILPDKVGIRNLNENEIDEHRRISSIYHRKGIPQLNLDSIDFLSGSARADDKWITTQTIEKEVLVPNTISIEPMMEISQIREKLKKLSDTTLKKRFYIQLALGTEGKGIERYELDGNFENFVQKIYMLSRKEKLIVREEVGNLRYQTDRKITFRINVSSLEGITQAESGFAQVGAIGSVISKASQGGDIISFQRASEELYYVDHKGNLQYFPLNKDIMVGIFTTAEKALSALNQGLNRDIILEFAGIDIELELKGDYLAYYVLDINPRPAGLRHAANLKNRDEILPSIRIFQKLNQL